MNSKGNERNATGIGSPSRAIHRLIEWAAVAIELLTVTVIVSHAVRPKLITLGKTRTVIVVPLLASERSFPASALGAVAEAKAQPPKLVILSPRSMVHRGVRHRGGSVTWSLLIGEGVCGIACEIY